MHHLLVCVTLSAVWVGGASAIAKASADKNGAPSVFADQATSSLFRARLSTVPIDLLMQRTITGRGSVTATLAGTTLAVKGTFEGLTSPATMARIHRGPKGIRGPAVLDLMVSQATSGTVAGTFELTAEQVDNLAHSRLYIQLHSQKAPDGNLWGWLLPDEARR